MFKKSVNLIKPYKQIKIKNKTKYKYTIRNLE